MRNILLFVLLLFVVFIFAIYKNEQYTKDTKYKVTADNSTTYVKENISLSDGCVKFKEVNSNIEITKCGNFTIKESQ